MCYICDGISEQINIKHPCEYYNLVNQIRDMIKENILILDKGNCDFYELDRNKPFTNDIIYHTFKCKNCERKFSLCVETYHGSGGNWQVKE